MSENSQVGTYCDQTRRQAEGSDMPTCYHPECLFDDVMHYDSIWGTRIAACVSARQGATCDLEAGHTSPHQWNKTDHERFENRGRHLWLMAHVATCTTCDLYPENNRPIECIELQRYLNTDAGTVPEPFAFGPAPLLRGDAVPLPGFESVATAAPEGTKSWSA